MQDDLKTESAPVGTPRPNSLIATTASPRDFFFLSQLSNLGSGCESPTPTATSAPADSLSGG